MQLKTRAEEEKKRTEKITAGALPRKIKKYGKKLMEQTEAVTSPSSPSSQNETDYALNTIEKETKAVAEETVYTAGKFTARRVRQIHHLRKREKGKKEESSGEKSSKTGRENRMGNASPPGEETKEEKLRIYTRLPRENQKQNFDKSSETKIYTPHSKGQEKKTDTRFYQRQKAWRTAFKTRRRRASLKRKEEMAGKVKRWKASLLGIGLCLLVVLLVGGVVFLSTGLISSSSGILFSNEIVTEGDLTLQDAIREINEEFQATIEEEEEASGLTQSIVEGSKSTWREILSLYAIKYQRDCKDEVFSVNEEKIQEMKAIFWDCNSYELSRELRKEDGEKPEAGISDEELTETLVVNVYHKDAEEMAEEYSFTTLEKRQLNLLLSDEVEDLWNKLLYGTGSYSGLVEAAVSQLGEIGGEPYWSWWGYRARVEWCAIFVSWCGEQCGYLEEEKMPKFENCQNGIRQFQEDYEFEDGDAVPESGWIIFFDWGGDGIADHVGIVESCEDGIVHTIEGNSGDMCREKTYPVGSSVIVGYGIPDSEENGKI